MSFLNIKKGFLKTFFLFFAVVSCLGFIGRAQAGTNEARTYFQIHMPEQVLNPTGAFQCLMISAVPGTSVPSPLSFQLVQDLRNGFETILTEFSNGVGGNQLSSDWDVQIQNILKQNQYACLGLNDVNFGVNPPAQFLKREGNLGLLMLMAGSNSPGPMVATPIPGALNPPTSGFLVTLSPSSLDFNQVTLNTKSSTQQVTITNINNNAITIGYVSATVDFNILTTSTCSQQMSLAPSASCTFDLSFTPSILGVANGFLTIGVIDSNNNATGVPVSLTGTGIQGTVINPNQTPTPTPDPSAAAGGGCSMGLATSAQATSLLSLLPFGLVAFARVYRKK